MGRMPTAQMVLVVYCVIRGFSLEICNDNIPINKNTWTSYVKYVGMDCGEALERNRQDPAEKYSLAQWDEMAFDKRKYTEVQELGTGEYSGRLRPSRLTQSLGNLKLWISNFYL